MSNQGVLLGKIVPAWSRSSTGPTCTSSSRGNGIIVVLLTHPLLVAIQVVIVIIIVKRHGGGRIMDGNRIMLVFCVGQKKRGGKR